MTAKRFTLWRTLDLDGHTDEWDIIDNTRLNIDEGHISEEEVVELLNALHEENQTLKQSASKMIKYFERCKYAIKKEEYQGYKELKELLE